MADEELFSLCWNNFNTNLSAGFHESLVNGDLVDVTLAAEGQLVKAHRLVLSVCSPYFRKMFTNMPANQHAFVFLKDVTHSALKELIQFMYCGEVNVKQEALPAFISTAEALQIKGLTDSGDTAPPPSSPTKVATPSHSSASSPSRVRTQQRTVTRTTYKMESEDSADERQMIQVHTQKRSAPRQTIALQSIPSSKRSKIETIETVEQAADTSATTRISEKSDAEFIDLPITETLSAKAEPVEEYAEDTAEDIEQEGEATYVEEDTYGDMKYDESYFTENDESNAKANVSGFGESYAEGDQSVAEAQGEEIESYESSSMVEKPPVVIVKRCSMTSAQMKQQEPIEEEKQIPEDQIIKKLPNGHALCIIKRTRVKGFCVECILRKGDFENYKKTLPKIVTFCPKCPGGRWFCEPCFDRLH
ncbi:modifier of mdg4-like isoform X7 [Phlebotomus argentipes]|uniref:modifier of mdg4-like isoform X7 n=1 Tax=Phlebotomus argentipes TaxID=94469 RepID=UPI002892B224|nr:modifier of mdg4-like isoform X7 [Phlebotomus argentipes]